MLFEQVSKIFNSPRTLYLIINMYHEGIETDYQSARNGSIFEQRESLPFHEKLLVGAAFMHESVPAEACTVQHC